MPVVSRSAAAAAAAGRPPLRGCVAAWAGWHVASRAAPTQPAATRSGPAARSAAAAAAAMHSVSSAAVCVDERHAERMENRVLM